MPATVRLTRLPGGGFRVEGAGAVAIDAVPDDAGFSVSGGGAWRLAWSASERGWILERKDAARSEAGRTTTIVPDQATGPSIVLLEDGRLFQLTPAGLSDPRVELSRFDVPGSYLVARRTDAGWGLERTTAGAALDAPIALWILVCAEIGRLEGWCEESR